MLTFQEYLIENIKNETGKEFSSFGEGFSDMVRSVIKTAGKIVQVQPGKEPKPLAPEEEGTGTPTGKGLLAAAAVIAPFVSGIAQDTRIDPTTVSPTLIRTNSTGLHGHEVVITPTQTSTQKEKNENDK